MSYVFRTQNTGSIDIKDWSESSIYGNNVIRNIRDPLETSVLSKASTSIPSPFARMQLFETAFQMVNKNHLGSNLYHMLVSDCFDLLNLIFNDGCSEHISFKIWDKETQLKLLDQADSPDSHKLLADSLKMYLDGNRFKNTREFYLIYYDDILIGGTSPLSLVFTSPNWQRNMQQRGIILNAFENDIFFDDIPAPLHHRDLKFQLYIQKFRLAYLSELNNQCPAFAEYLRISMRNNTSLNKDITQLQNEGYSKSNFLNNENEYNWLKIGTKPGVDLYSGNFPILVYDVGHFGSFVEQNSDFVIKPSVNYYNEFFDENGNVVQIPKPLVLQQGFTGSLNYLQSKWDPSTLITDLPHIPLNRRDLPGKVGEKYPYVTAGDFFEKKIIMMPYVLNKENFYTGFNGDFKYLLPIKKEYFNFFTIKDLQEHLSVTLLKDQINFELRVPLKNNNFIVFEKKYNVNNQNEVIKFDFGRGFNFGIFPFYKVADQQSINEYVVQLVDNIDEGIDLNFYQFPQIVYNRPLSVVSNVRVKKRGNTAGSSYYKLSENNDNSFDLVEVIFQGIYKGLIIPKLNEVEVGNNEKEFYFAVDFGTSNTHIAYCDSNTPNIKSFDIGKGDIQMVLFNKREVSSDNLKLGETYNFGWGTFPAMQAFKNREFVPSIIGEESSIKYPVRTATCEHVSFEKGEPDLFTNINIGFSVDFEEAVISNTLFNTNIKWGIEDNPGDTAAINRVDAYFKQVLWMIKNKILLNNGAAKLNLTWFFPLCMKNGTVKDFEKLWENSINKIFGDEFFIKNILSETESEAPYFANQQLKGLYEGQDSLNIDVGGGTTDMLFFDKSKGNYYSISTKFAANDIWGDGVADHGGSSSPKDNGFLLLIENGIRNGQIQFNEASSIQGYYETFKSNPVFDSSDVISFIFKNKNEFKLDNAVSGHPIAFVLFLHYSALIYYVAKVIDKKDISIPVYVTFSGMGSEYLKLILPTESDLTEFTKLLLSKFTDKLIPKAFKVMLSDSPKELTSVGGILKLKNPPTNENEISPIQLVLLGDDNKHDDDVMKYQMNDIETFKMNVLNSLYKFYDILINDEDLRSEFDRYGIKLADEPEELLNYLKEVSEQSFNKMKYKLEKTSAPSDRIEDTPFFWGLKETLYRLSQKLVE